MPRSPIPSTTSAQSLDDVCNFCSVLEKVCSLISIQILLEPYRYLSDHPGKDIRSKLIDAFNVWLNVPSEALKVITNVIKLLHTASLM